MSQIEYIEDAGRKVFRVTIESANEAIFVAKVDEINAWEDDDAATPAEFEPYLHCTIKWDSCSYFNFENQMHICGVQYYKLHVLLMRELYKMAFKYMGCEPQSDEVWEDKQ